MVHNREKRRGRRVPINVSVVIDGVERMFIPTRSRDISLTGAFLLATEPIPIGTECDLTFYAGQPGNERSFWVRGRVARLGQDGVGVEFVNVGNEARRGIEALLRMVAYGQGRLRR